MKKFRPGVSFGDFLVRDSSSTPGRVKETAQVNMPRLSAWMWVGAMAVVGLLVARLANLQLFYGERYRVLADENRVKQIRLPAQRGTIYDRNGLVLAEGLERTYPLGAAAVHAVGYVGEVGELEVGLLMEKGGKYEAGGSLGREGIEQQYEERLKGEDGGRLVEVDTAGKIVRELGKQKAVAGTDVKLTIDGQLQRIAYEALGDKKGAVVASDPKTGGVLVLTSSPGFDPADVEGALGKENTPFLNRAIGGIYAPGSVFKMVSAAAALVEKKLGSDFTYKDTGVINIGNFSYTNWFFTQYGRTEGEVGWERALARSVDTFFYKVGEGTGVLMMAKWANNLGLGVKTGIDIPGEVEGLIPTPEWKKRVKGEAWFLGNTYHMAIGQGDILVTPLQVNVMTNALANGGQKCRPYLNQAREVKCEELGIGEEVLAVIREGMVGACEPGGTAFPLFDFEPRVACKTGTAEYVRADGKIGTHAWLTAYAPADDPRISVTVLVEGGGEGSRAAAPIARKVLAEFFGVEDHYNYAAIAGEGE